MVYGAATVLTRAVALLIVPIYTRILSPKEYGAIDILSIFGSFVTVVIALEIGQAVARFLPEGSHLERARVVSTATLFALGAYAGFVVIALGFVEPLRTILVGDQVTPSAVASSVVWIGSVGAFQFIQTVLRFAMRPKIFMIASLIFALGGMAVSVVLVVGFDAGVTGVFSGQAVGAIVGLAVGAWFIRPMYVATFDISVLRRMLAFSGPLVPASLGVLVTLYVDRIALSLLTSLAAVGVFGIGYRLSALVSMLLIGFQMALTPLIYQRYREASTPGDLARVFRTFLAFALVVGAGLSMFAAEILHVVTTPSYYAAAGVVPFLVSAILLANMYVFMPGLSIAKQTRTIASITIVGAVLNTTLNLILIPLINIQGAALATLISSTIVFAAQAAYSQRTYPVPHRWAPIAMAVVVYAVIIGVTYPLEPMAPSSVVAKAFGMAILAAFIVRGGLVSSAELTAMFGRLRPGVSSKW